MNCPTVQASFAAALALALLPTLPAQQPAAAPGPRLVLTRQTMPYEPPWRGDTRLGFEVVLSHPCMAGAPLEEDFVLDPEGGYAKAIDLDVTDGNGAPVAMTFTRSGGSDAGPLVLRRLGQRTMWFDFDPTTQSTPLPPGRLQFTARLHTTTGKWRGTVTSAPVAIEVAAAPSPGLRLLGTAVADATGPADGKLFRGWPAFVAVEVRVPEGGDGVRTPAPPEDWSPLLQLSLLTEAGVAIADAARQLPVATPARGLLLAGNALVVPFLIPADVTGKLAAGRYRWQATLHVPPPPNGGSGSTPTWTGTVAAVATSQCAAPPDPLPPGLQPAHERALVRADLAQALLLRAEAERPGGYLAERRRVVEQMAAPLLAAERRARAALHDHPDDPDASLLLAEVFAAADDPIRAGLYANGAVAAELERRRAQATAAGKDAQAEEPSLALALHADAIARGGRPMDPDFAPTLQAALATLRSGNAVAGTTPLPSPSPSPTTTPPTQPTKPDDAVQGKVSQGDAATLDATFTADAQGQWATSAVASSQYGTENYSATRTTGAPDVAQHGDNANAWAPGSADGGEEWLRLSFTRPTKATAVRIRQSSQPGALTRVTLLGQGGERLVVFDGADPNQYAANTIAWFVVAFPAPKFAVATVELTFDTKKVAGWNEIDAVQLVAEPMAR